MLRKTRRATDRAVGAMAVIVGAILLSLPSWQAQAGGEPEWVKRGSSAVTTSDGRRIFYGVGLASGIKNPPLLRSAADNRARSELGKVFEVFSASLMQDYMDSSGKQEVQQAVKTFSSMSLEGVEIVDRYIAGDGTMFALAALDLQKVMEGVRRAKELGAVKSHTEKVDVNEIFDARAQQKPPPPAPVVAQGSSAAPSVGKPAAGAPRQAGEKPAWVEGADPRFPGQTYLCAVGFGPERSMAENGSLAALSRVFEARVQAVSQDFMGAYAKTGAEPVEVQSAESLTKVSTNKVFSGVQILEIWTDGASKTNYALACLERAKAGAVLREQIGQADAEAGRALEQAGSADKMGKVKALSRALESIVKREVLNAELRIVDADGIGVSGPYAHVDVAAAFESAVDELSIGVLAEGPFDSDFRGALLEGLTQRGYKVSDDVGGGQGGFDAVVTATIRVEDGGAGTGTAFNVHFARAVINVVVKNMATQKIIASFNDSRKEGSRSLEEAQRLAVRKLAQKLIGPIAAKIDAAMKGGQ